jgi:hypothetical protein
MGEVREPTELERMIVLAQEGRASGEAVLTVFASSQVVVPSGTPVTDNLAQLQPLLFDRGGASMLAVFTHQDEIGDFAELAEFSLSIVGRLLLVAMPPGSGLVVNPSRSIGFELPPEGIASFVRDIEEQASSGNDRLSQAIVDYVGFGATSQPQRDPGRVAESQDDDGSAVLADTLAIVAELDSLQLDWTAQTLVTAGAGARATMAERHPELSEEALDALSWAFTYEWR